MPDPVPLASARSLREELEASGAQPNSRLSALSRYMLDHYDELHALKVVERYSWQAIVAVLARQPGLAGIPGQPVTVAAAKLAWSRTVRRKLPAAAPSAVLASRDTAAAAIPGAPIGPAPLPQVAPAAPVPAAATQSVSQFRVEPFAAADQPGPDIRPARPRGVPLAPTPSQMAAKSTAPLLGEDEVERHIADLAARQGGPKMPPPEVL